MRRTELEDCLKWWCEDVVDAYDAITDSKTKEATAYKLLCRMDVLLSRAFGTYAVLSNNETIWK